MFNIINAKLLLKLKEKGHPDTEYEDVTAEVQFGNFNNKKTVPLDVDMYSNWYYLKADSVMATSWVNDNGTWYYLNTSGDMLANTTIDGYILGAIDKRK